MKPPRVALDTNLHVSNLLSPASRSAGRRCHEQVVTGRWKAVLDTATYLEHEDVLRRPELGLAPELVTAYLDALAECAEWCSAQPASVLLRDAGDQKWLNLLQGSEADA